jgi:hypothetical protein
MSIDEIKDLIEDLEGYIPEEYVPTDFEVVFSIDMDGVLAEFMNNPDTYLPTLRKMRGDVLEMPKSSDENYVQVLTEWASTLLDEVKDYQGDINRYTNEVKESFGNILKNLNSPPWMEDEYYRWLPQMSETVQAIRYLSKVPQIMDENGNIYNLKIKICSCSPSEKATLDKYIWLSQNLPEVDNITIVPYDENNSGRNKAIALGLPIVDPSLPEPTTDLIRFRSKCVFIHLDDNTKVLKDMEKHGCKGIKGMNGINHGNHWFGPRVDLTQPSVRLFKDLISNLSKVTTQEISRRYNLETSKDYNEPDLANIPDIEQLNEINTEKNREGGDNGIR